jgi:hypothetical protein
MSYDEALINTAQAVRPSIPSPASHPFRDIDPNPEVGLLILRCAIFGVGGIVVTHVAAVLNALVKIFPLPFGCSLCTSCRRITNDPRRKFLGHEGSAFFRNFCRDGWDALWHQQDGGANYAR